MNFQIMPVELAIMTVRPVKVKNVGMKRQEPLENWMSKPQNSLVEQAQYADVAPQDKRRKVAFKKRCFGIRREFYQNIEQILSESIGFPSRILSKSHQNPWETLSQSKGNPIRIHRKSYQNP